MFVENSFKMRINFLSILLPVLLLQLGAELTVAQEVRYEQNALIRIDSLSSGVILKPAASSAPGFSSPVDGVPFSYEFERPEGLLRILEMLSGCQECKLPAEDPGYTIEEIEYVLRKLLAERGIAIDQKIAESPVPSPGEPDQRIVDQRLRADETRILVDESVIQRQLTDEAETDAQIPEPATVIDPQAQVAPLPPTPQVDRESLEEMIARVEKDFTEKGRFTDQQVQFEFDSYELLQESFPLLIAVGAYMVNNPDQKILITGNTCIIGPLEYNYRLSELRAESVANYLLSNYPEIDAEQISTEGHGPDNPIADNDDPEVRYLNRRVEFILKGEQ